MPPLAESQRDALLAEFGGLRTFCYSLTGNGADADDLLQTTVEKILVVNAQTFRDCSENGAASRATLP